MDYEDSSTESSTDIEKKDNLEIDQMNKITNSIILEMEENHLKNAEMYDFMKDQIELLNDKNQETRKMMGKSLELNSKIVDQKIEILKIKAQLINPNNQTNINLNFGNKGSDTNDIIDIIEKEIDCE